jgi:PAS domain S-box-containing protein
VNTGVETLTRSPRGGLRVVVLGCLFVLFLSQTVVLGRSVVSQLQSLSSASTDNLQWNIAQMEVELLRMRVALESVERVGEGALPDLRRRFDVFNSRFDTVSESAARNYLAASAEGRRRLTAYRNFLDESVPVIDGSDEKLLQAVPHLRRAVGSLEGQMRALSLEGVSASALAEDSTRRQVFQTLFRLALSTVALVAALIASAIVLWFLYQRARRIGAEHDAARVRLEAMVTSSLDAIIVVDTDGLILEFNGAAEQVFGFTTDEVVGSLVADVLVPPHLRQAHFEGMDRYIRTGHKRVVGKGRVRLEAMHKSGAIFPVEMTLSEARSGDQVVFVSFLRDISQQVAAEDAMKQARDEAESAAKAKTDLLTVMSHEMRTPLNGILGSLDLIERDNLSPRQEQFLEAIRVSGDMLLSHVTDVLDLSRLEAGDQPTSEAPFSLAAVAEEVIHSAKPLAERQGNKIRLDLLSADLGLVQGDEMRLRQCLVNLLGNANKFTENGSVSLEVERLPDGMVECRVHDSGIGIPARDLPRIFEDFVTIDTAYARKNAGTGLGLPITKRLVEGMGGEITVDSIEGEGSLFTLRLPLDPVVAEAPSAPVKAKAAPAVTGRVVLVVDDNEINRMIAAETLRSRGIEAVEADGARSALALARENKFDLVLMDISMPEIDGIQALQMLRARGGASAGVPVLALTAHASREDSLRILQAGFDDMLTKPLLQPEVDRILSQYCQAADVASEDELDVRALLGDEIYEQNVRRFLDDLKAVLPQIRGAKRLTKELKPLVHDMAGCASVLGETQLQQQFQAIEALKDHEWDSHLSDHLAQVELRVGALEQGLRGAA